MAFFFNSIEEPQRSKVIALSCRFAALGAARHSSGKMVIATINYDRMIDLRIDAKSTLSSDRISFP